MKEHIHVFFFFFCSYIFLYQESYFEQPSVESLLFIQFLEMEKLFKHNSLTKNSLFKFDKLRLLYSVLYLD